MLNELNNIARPYAQAAFDCALEANALDAWQVMLTQLGAMVGNKTVEQLIKNPSVDHEALLALLMSLCELKLNEAQQDFLTLLLDKKRLIVLPNIALRFARLCSKYHRAITVSVTTAYELTVEQEKALTAALEKRFNVKVTLASEIDNTILGGAVVRIGDRVFNHSGKQLLKQLSNSLREGILNET